MEMARRDSGSSAMSACSQDGKMASTESKVAVVDIEEILVETAKALLHEDVEEKVDMAHPEIIKNRMYVTHVKTEYMDQHPSGAPTEHVLYTATFRNNTSTAQSYHMTTERRTTSTCDISLRETFTMGSSAELKLTPPNAAVVANAGFSTHLSVEKGVNQTFQRELIWTVNKFIEVPPGHVTKAELVIKEDTSDQDFTIVTRFEGEVEVVFKPRKTSGRDIRLLLDIPRVLMDKEGFKTDDKGRPYFVTRGKYLCRCGIEQDIQLTQSRLHTAADQ